MVGGVHHHGRADAVKGPSLQQVLFATAAFLRRGADNADASPQLVGQNGRGQPGTQSGGGDDVVAAGMPDLGQGVVLADHRNMGPGASCRGYERCVQVKCRPLHVKPFVLQDAAEQIVGGVLLKAEFRGLVDLVGDAEQTGCSGIDLRGHLLLDHIGCHGANATSLVGDRRDYVVLSHTTTMSAAGSTRIDRLAVR